MIRELKAIAATREVRMFPQEIEYRIRRPAVTAEEAKTATKAFLNEHHRHLNEEEIEALREILSETWTGDHVRYARAICEALATRLHG